MKIESVRIFASADSDPKFQEGFVWVFGDPIEDLKMMVSEIEKFIQSRTDLTKVTSATKPIDV